MATVRRSKTGSDPLPGGNPPSLPKKKPHDTEGAWRGGRLYSHTDLRWDSSLNGRMSYQNGVTNNQTVARNGRGETFHKREFGKSTESVLIE